MDNFLQIDEIKRYQKYLQEMTGEKVDEEVAALIWIHKYALQWRRNHSPFADMAS